MKRSLLIFALFLFLLVGMVRCTPKSEAAAPTVVPNKLVVVRAPVPGTPVIVAQPALVATIYTHILSLPPKPAEVCPFYVKAEYKLTFIHVTTPTLHATVLEGGCNSVVLSDATPHVRALDGTLLKLLARSGPSSGVASPDAFAGGYRPSDLQDAYNLPSFRQGKGQTVAIVDAYNDPYAESDLAVYRSSFGLPMCDTPDGCFRKVGQDGSSHFPRPHVGWSSEIALDLDMVSAVCPLCHILLVEANTPRLEDLGKAVDTAVRLGAHIVSNSYGVPEDASMRSLQHYWSHAGVIITAASGDSGYGVQIPAAFNTVTAVGGTTLVRSNNTRGWDETAWFGTGSGCSVQASKPVWQWDNSCNKRTVTDVAAVSDPATGVAVYNTYGAPGWSVYGGTSAAAPIIAGVYALAGNAGSTTNEHLYSTTDALNGVVSGNNGTCGGSYLCTAGPGYNGPTGLGTPNGVGAF